jgi:uncharacterized protein YigE (DUF2233 family)
MYSRCAIAIGISVALATNYAVSDEAESIAVPVSNSSYRFQLIDNESLRDHLTVTQVFREHDAVCAINGGFFDENFRAVGYYKVDGNVLSPHHSRGLSGYVCMDYAGNLSIHFKSVDPDKYTSVFQAGPMLIDPGGKPGIDRDDGKVADRAAIVQLENGSFVMLYHAKTTLYALSQFILTTYPNVERAINLDGGPEAGIATKIPSLQIHENTIASKAYIVVKERTLPNEQIGITTDK